jgi:hypothetical protein
MEGILDEVITTKVQRGGTVLAIHPDANGKTFGNVLYNLFFGVSGGSGRSSGRGSGSCGVDFLFLADNLGSASPPPLL